LLHFLQPNCC